MIFLIQPISLRNNGFSNVFWSCEKLLTSSLTDRRGWSIITCHYSWLLAHLGQDKNIAHRAVSIRFIIKYQTSRTTKTLKERVFFLVWAYRRGIIISTSLPFHQNLSFTLGPTGKQLWADLHLQFYEVVKREGNFCQKFIEGNLRDVNILALILSVFMSMGFAKDILCFQVKFINSCCPQRF